MVRKQKEVH